MRSVTVRICAVEFSATIVAISEWLHANHCEPTRYKYEEHEDAVLVTVDFPGETEAEAFATRFNGVYVFTRNGQTLGPQSRRSQASPVR
jgi:hypothetical protein